MIFKIVFYTILAVCALMCVVYRTKVAELIERTKVFYGEVEVEMKKVSWPTRDEVIGNTVVVLVGVVALTVIIGLADWGLGQAVQLVFVR